MTQKKERKPARGHVTETYRGYNGPGWELSITGSPAWVKRMAKKWVAEIQQIANARSESKATN